jgi:pyridoxamine 5'-phosphate oxidase
LPKAIPPAWDGFLVGGANGPFFICPFQPNFVKKKMQPIADIRTDYKQRSLSETDVAAGALAQFGVWWNEAVASQIDEVNAMTLATASPSGVPDARIVLLKGYDERGFVFFTNYQSAKGRQLAENGQACLVFFWKELERQVKVYGSVEQVPAGESDDYFASRPRESRIGAWCSPQSRVIKGRQVLEDNVTNYTERFADGDVPRPPHWGGYLVRPQSIEFWQGRPSRLHDRIRYTLQTDGGWLIERLAP